MSLTIDNLEQTGRNVNIFVAGLDEIQCTKEGLMHFCQTRLIIDTHEKDMKNIFNIPSDHERLLKRVFCSHETREKYCGSRRRLKEFPTIWFRDDLTRNREVILPELII